MDVARYRQLRAVQRRLYEAEQFTVVSRDGEQLVNACDGRAVAIAVSTIAVYTRTNERELANFFSFRWSRHNSQEDCERMESFNQFILTL